jgi:acyl transferase domain-containing protein/acyl carrier protein
MSADSSIEEHQDPAHGIAIIGMAGRFPGSPDLETFWRNLRGGVECITVFGDEELRAAGVDPAELADPLYVRARGTLPGIELFDPAFFGFTPREAELLDPQHRAFLECAWQAFEDAGYDPDRFPGRVAVFGGAGAATYLLHNLLPNTDLLEKVGSLQAVLMNEGDFLTTRVSYKLNLRGPSVDVQTACSTALVAIHMACQSLLSGESDMALAGGVSIDVPQVSGYLYQEASVMSPDGHCRAFDEKAAGTVNGSGSGVVLLKRLADALADGDSIHAVILGSAINNDGSGKVGFTAPSVEGQSEAIAESLLMAGVDPATVTYVEAHGSGTPLGDPVEIAALTLAFQGGLDDAAQRTGFCAVGSVKTNLGHCNAAAGVAGLIKTVLSLKHREIPPSLGFERPNPQIDFAASPFHVPTRLTPWRTGETAPRRAGVSSFGLGGTNAHIVLEEAPPRAAGEPASRREQFLVLSARTPEALERVAANLADHLEAHPDLPLPDLAWTLQVGRKGLDHRRALVVRDTASAVADLRAGSAGVAGRREGTGDRPVAFLFPGLGDQYVGMARGLYEAEPAFREAFDLCVEGLRPELGLDLRQAVFSETTPRKSGSTGPDLRAMLRRDGAEQDPAAARLAETAVAQPACFAVEYALARLLMSWGIRPQAMIGYSLGEYVAATLAGVLSLADALKLVARRARLIQELPGGAMLAVPLAEEAVRPLLAEADARLSLAATNGPHFSVAGGPSEAIEALDSLLTARGVSTIRLQTTHAFHTTMMEPAAEAFRELVRGFTLRNPEIPYLSNVTGTWITPDDLADPSYWVRHMTGTVRFAEGLGELLASRETVLVEAGPGATLGSLARQHPAAPAGLVTLSALRRGSEERSDIDHLLEEVGRLWIAGGAVDWAAFHHGETGERRLRVPLPTYPFERVRCWIDPPRRGEAARRVAAPVPADTTDIAGWGWLPVWRQAQPAGLASTASLLAALMESDQTGPDGEAGWLIFSGAPSRGLGERLVARLRQAGHRVAAVLPGDPGGGFSTLGEGVYALDPAGRAGYDELVKVLRAGNSGRMPGRILHLWGVSDETSSYDEAQQAGLLSLMFLEQALTGAAGASGGGGPAGADIRIGMVASHLHEVVDGDRVEPAKATILGACRVIHQESSHLTCCSIDVVPAPPGSPAEERLADQLLAELSAAGEDIEPAVAYRGRQRWVRRFERLRLPEAAASRLRAGGAYLITDAVHAVGLGAAEYLTGTLGARAALVLPPDFPPREKWEGWQALPEVPPGQDVAGAAIRRLLALEPRAEVAILRADITDPVQARAALAAVRERFGRLDGVLHTAGFFTGGLIQLKTPESLAASLRPVVRGAETLLTVLSETGGEPEAPPFLALTGSTLTFAGGLGQLDIAAAGAYVDALAESRAAQADPGAVETPEIIAVHWDPYQWDGWLALGTSVLPGVSPEQLRQDLETYGTPSARSGEALRRLLATPLTRAVVSARDLEAVIAETDSFTMDTFLAQMEKLRAEQQGQARAGRAGIAIPYAEPRNELEQQVANVWEELFGIQPIGRDDNFLELGGHSLLAIQMATQLRTLFAVDLPVTVLFEAPTVGELAAVIAREQGGGEVAEDDLESLLALVEGLSPEEALEKMQELGAVAP